MTQTRQRVVLVLIDARAVAAFVARNAAGEAAKPGRLLVAAVRLAAAILVIGIFAAQVWRAAA
ncbi:MAG: hypothetical protein ACRD1M_16100 [Terriglobales bacterium]